MGLIVLISCKKDEKVPENPFDDPSLQAPAPTPSGFNPSPTSFEYIYQNVLNVTCDNSNCHDGNFEPDFRNISSAYNSMVYAPAEKTPDTINMRYRVFPGDANKSVLLYRLTQIPGITLGSVLTFGQGRMPWNDTLWNANPTHATYIQNIKDWINNGAKDVFGNSPVQGNKNPNTLGLQITNTGNASAFVRPKYINISKTNGPVDIWVYVNDFETAAENMSSAEIKFSTNRYDFSSAVTQTLTYVANGNMYQDMSLSDNVKYNYKLTNFSLNSIIPDTGYIFIRTYIKDPDHTTPAETPNNGSKYYTDYFVIKVTP